MACVLRFSDWSSDACSSEPPKREAPTHSYNDGQKSAESRSEWSVPPILTYTNTWPPIPHTKRATGNPTLPPNAHIIDTASGSKALSPRATSHFRHRQVLSILKSRRVKAIGMQIPTQSQHPPIPTKTHPTLIVKLPTTHMSHTIPHLHTP